MNRFHVIFCALLLLLFGPTRVGAQTNHLNRMARSNLVGARIQGMLLNKVLARVAAAKLLTSG